jgi:protein deglycase
MPKRVLCLLVPGFEEIETVAPIDLLRRAEVEVLIASITRELLVTGRCGMCLRADATLDEVATSDFDLLFLPGGPGVTQLRADGRAARLARAFVDSGKLVAAICAAPTILADAELLTGRRFTAHYSVATELPQTLSAERVVEDGQVLTSRGAGTAIDFGLALVGRLCGPDSAARVAHAIMA